MYILNLENGYIRFSNTQKPDIPVSLRFSFTEDDICFFANKAANSNELRYTDVYIKEGVSYNVRLSDELKNRHINTAYFKEVLPGIYQLSDSV